MKRLKVLWDDLHPELGHFNKKYLRQQYTYITQIGYILEMQTNDEEISIITENPERLSAIRNDNITEINTTPPQNNIKNEIIINSLIYSSAVTLKQHLSNANLKFTNNTKSTELK